MTTQTEALKALDTALWRARAAATPTSILHIQVGHAIDALSQLKTALAQPEQPKVRTGDCLLTGFCASEGHKIQKAEPEQEPVAEITVRNGHWIDTTGFAAVKNLADGLHKLYTTPPQRTWVGLTNDEVNNFAAGCHLGKSVQGAIYEAEAKLKEKNT